MVLQVILRSNGAAIFFFLFKYFSISMQRSPVGPFHFHKFVDIIQMAEMSLFAIQNRAAAVRAHPDGGSILSGHPKDILADCFDIFECLDFQIISFVVAGINQILEGFADQFIGPLITQNGAEIRVDINQAAVLEHIEADMGLVTNRPVIDRQLRNVQFYSFIRFLQWNRAQCFHFYSPKLRPPRMSFYLGLNKNVPYNYF